MSDYPKYILKKDTPEFKAGQMFNRGEDAYGNDCLFAIAAPVRVFEVSSIDNFDEWFEEAKGPEWVRKCIKSIEYKCKGITVFIRLRCIKDFYTWFCDEGGDAKIEKWSEGWEDEFTACEGDDCDGEKLLYLNQLVRDGYIEIKDNPNIVWEDEDD